MKEISTESLEVLGVFLVGAIFYWMVRRKERQEKIDSNMREFRQEIDNLKDTLRDVERKLQGVK